MAKGTTYQAGSVAINLALNSAQFSAALDAAKNNLAKAQAAMSTTFKMLQTSAQQMGKVFSVVTSGIKSDLSAMGDAFKNMAQSLITPSTWIKGFLGVGVAITGVTTLAIMHRKEMEKVASAYKHTNEEMNQLTYIAAATGVEYEQIADTIREVQSRVNDLIESGGEATDRMGEFFKLRDMNAKKWGDLKDPIEVLDNFRASYQELVKTKGLSAAADAMNELGDSAAYASKVCATTNEEFNRLKMMGLATAFDISNLNNSLSKFKELYEIGERFLVNVVNRIAPAFTSVMDEWYDDVITAVTGQKGMDAASKEFDKHVTTWADNIFDYLMKCLDQMQNFLRKLEGAMKYAQEAWNNNAGLIGGQVTATYDVNELTATERALHEEQMQNRKALAKAEADLAKAQTDRKSKQTGWLLDSPEALEAKTRETEAVAHYDKMAKIVQEGNNTIAKLNADHTKEEKATLDNMSSAQRQFYESSQADLVEYHTVAETLSKAKSLRKGYKDGDKEVSQLDAIIKENEEKLPQLKAQAKDIKDTYKEMFDLNMSEDLRARQQGGKNARDILAGFDTGGTSEGSGLARKVKQASGDASKALAAFEAFKESLMEKRLQIDEFMSEKRNEGMDENIKREKREQQQIDKLYADLDKTTKKYYEEQIKSKKAGSAEAIKLQREMNEVLLMNQTEHEQTITELMKIQKEERIKDSNKSLKEFRETMDAVQEKYQFGSGGKTATYQKEEDALEKSLQKYIDDYQEKHKEAIKNVNSVEYETFKQLQVDKLKLLDEYHKNALNSYYDTMSSANTVGQTIALSKGKGESPFPGVSVSDVEAASKNVNDQEKLIVESSGTVMAEAAKNNKKMFEMKKKMDIANALMSTYNAANAAMTSAPGPAGWAMAGLTVAMGLMNVQNIKAQEWVGQAHSGIDYVPNEGTWNLAKGERVVGAALNEDLTRTLSVINSGGLQGSKGLSISAPMHIEGNVVDEGWFDSKLKAHRDSIAGLVQEYNSDRGI
ncbi:hypothetical protein [Aeromonas taiwanensis]